MKAGPILLLASLCAGIGAAAMAAESAPGASRLSSDKLFIDKVKPLLDSRCVSCHGPDKVKGGLRLDSREAALKPGESGLPAVVPGKPDQSLLLQAVMHSKKELEMPPKEKLTSNDVAVLERWIREGAPWPKGEIIPVTAADARNNQRIGDAWADSRNPIVRLFGGQRLDLWSLKPVKRAAPPQVKSKRWIRNPIDQFTLARLEKSGIAPAPEADRRPLARRLYFDLTGLPPNPAELQEFLEDRRPDAYERLVERLLESPGYSEHWARMWLDVIRYSDSNGFDWDEFRPKAWRFRDYVIRSFDADKPFDQFIREQLAGDELFEGPPKNAAEREALIATGYLRLGPQDNSAPLFNEQARARMELMADLTETTASAFLGLTMSCCRCHDHKFDPLSQADHFRLRAFFEPAKSADETPLDLAPEQDAIRKHNKALDGRLKPLEKERETLLAGAKKSLREERLAKLKPEERALLELPKGQRTNDVKAQFEALEKKVDPSDKDVKAALKDKEKERHKKVELEIAELKKQKRPFAMGLLMTDSTNQVPATRILFQGDYKQEKEAVAPGFLSILDPNPAVLRSAANQKTTGRRLTLAEWIASSKNPLTSRVLVNRVWQGYFGQGLVATPNDFGLAGAPPIHPELLDWLASEFTRQGWSLKKLHRLIVTSATYRQQTSKPRVSEEKARRQGPTGRRTKIVEAATESSNSVLPLTDPQPRRLTAEQLRDALLSVSGLLISKAGGPPVWPDLPPEILQANPAFLDDNETKTKGWYPSPRNEQHVRSIYLVQKRTVRVPFMEIFDLPENSTSCARRNESIVAPQALSLLNSPLAIEAAKAFAARVVREAGNEPNAQVAHAFSLALLRAPTPDEEKACRQLLELHSLTELCRAMLNLNEFAYID